MNTIAPNPSARQKLDLVQKRIPTVDALIRETEIQIQRLQGLLRDQTAQRDELINSIEPLKKELEMERQDNPSIQIDGDDSTSADSPTSGSRRASLKGTNVKISLPSAVLINYPDTPLPETPYSPPPTAILSPPPLQNRLFAGHTPSIAIAVSPDGASDPATPTAAVASKPIRTVVTKDAPQEIKILPMVRDDPHLEGPLTAKDNGFLEFVSERLEAVKIEKEVEEREDSLSPDSLPPEREAEHGEQLDGVVLKLTRPVNFGAPLGFGNVRVKKVSTTTLALKE